LVSWYFAGLKTHATPDQSRGEKKPRVFDDALVCQHGRHPAVLVPCGNSMMTGPVKPCQGRFELFMAYAPAQPSAITRPARNITNIFSASHDSGSPIRRESR